MQNTAAVYWGLFVAIGLFFSQRGSGQNNVVADVVHPAPNAASLGKYGDIPVSYHTGLPQISIPIYNLKEGSLSLPIAFSYHASGIKVEEMASWVGLGWSLQAGGVLTRVVRNAPDEDVSYSQHSGYWADYGYEFNPNTSEVQNLDKAASGQIDTEPDLFCFNVNGFTGKFFFNDNREVILVPQQDIRVEVLTSQHSWGHSFDEWILTMPDGVKYYFGGTDAVEKSASSSGYVFNTNMFIPSSWYLRRIESAGGEHLIELEYSTENYAYYHNASEYKVDASGACPAPTVAPNPVKTLVQGLRLQRITTSTQQVEFTANHIRQDLSRYILGSQSGTNDQSRALDAIEIKDSEGNCFKRFEILHSYFQSSNQGSVNFDPDQSDQKRLRLDAIQESSCHSGAHLPPYSFHYQHQVGLPRRRSYAQDHWGYFNGQYLNTVLTPKTVSSTQANCSAGAIRAPHASRMKEWSLKQVDYPTGGNTRFVMEAHQVSSYNFGQGSSTLAGGLRVKKIIHDDGDVDQSNDMVQSFGYTKSSGGTSGKLMSNVVYAGPLNVGTGSGYPSNLVFCPGSANIPYQFGSQSIAPMHQVSGSHVGYSQVKVAQAGQGWSLYEFDIQPYNSSTATSFPYESVPFNPENGNLTREKHYNEAGILQAETLYEYHNEVQESTTSLVPWGNGSYPGVLKIQLADVSGVCNNQTTGLGTVHARKGYALLSGLHQLVRQTETTYDADGSNALSKQTEYFYDHPDHVQLTAEQITNSDGSLHRTEYRYAHELNQSAMLQINMVAIPLEVRQKVNGQLTGGSKVAYSSFGNKILPQHHYQILQNGSLRQRATLALYGGKDNLRQYHPTGDQAAAYLWDASETRVIAEVRNARYDEVGYAGFEDEGKTVAENGRFRIVGTGPLYNADAQTGHQSLHLYQSGGVHRHLQYTAGLTGEYVLGFWYKGGSVFVKKNGSLQATAQYAGEWTYFEKKLSLNVLQKISLSPPNGTMPLIDEVRIHPVDAHMTTYAFDDAQRLTTITDLNNRSLSYAYDDFGRLSTIKDQDGNLTKAYAYLLSDQTPSYVKEILLRSEGYATLVQVNNAGVQDKQIQATYLDGLGRTIQEVAERSSPSQNDWIVPHAFNALGQETRTYLPFSQASNGGGFYPGAVALQTSFFHNSPQLAHLPVADRAMPFAERLWEHSPLQRLLEEGAPGADWQISAKGSSHSRKTQYRTNDNALDIDRVRIWQEINGQFVSNGLYPSGTLAVLESTDENGHRSLSYQDHLGRTLLERTQVDGQTQNSNALTWASTYYLFGQQGMIRHVIQPEGVLVLAGNGWDLYADDVLSDFGFSYEYDLFQRLRQKRIPGRDWEYMVYDDLDRIIMRQDGKLRADKNWLFTKYDVLGREIMNGVYFGGTANLSSMQTQADNHANLFESPANNTWAYSNNAFPPISSGTTIYSLTFYDHYDFNRNGIMEINEGHQVENMLSGFGGTSMNSLVNQRTRGMTTGVKTLVMDGSSQYQLTRTYYDDRGREMQTISENHLGGFDRVTYDKNFLGETTRSLHYHHTNDATVQVYQSFAYDHRSRLKESWQDVHAGSGTWSLDPVLLSAQNHNELGQLTERNLHSADQGQSFLQSVDYRFNIRGWLSRINQFNACHSSLSGTKKKSVSVIPAVGNDDHADLFSLELRYNEGTTDLPEAVAPLFNGNVAGMLWRAGNNCQVSAYGYQYDAMDRVKEADFALQNTITQVWDQQVDRYSVHGIDYDQNGNIQALQRRGAKSYNASKGTLGFGLMDNLSYVYKGNHLAKVSDAAYTGTLPFTVPQFDNQANAKILLSNPATFEYLYDANGNTKVDENKGITVQYNYFNKPTQIEFVNPSDSRFGQKINYRYLADGTRYLQSVLNAQGQTVQVTDYISGFQYEAQNTGANGQLGSRELSFFSHPEGRVRYDNGDFAYEYVLEDHLGNARVTFGDPDEDGEPELLQEDHYYPFGLPHSGNFLQATPGMQYRYNGVEFQSELGLQVYFTRFRTYDPVLGHWLETDPRASSLLQETPYNAFLNSPLQHADPAGDCPPGVDCTEPLSNMRIRLNRASNLGPGMVRRNSAGKLKFHAGHDLAAPEGSAVRSVMAGEVVGSGYSKSYGNYVTVKHEVKRQVTLGNEEFGIEPAFETDVYYSFYAHLKKSKVKVGDKVHLGKRIGKVGTTGNASGLTGDNVHLHFEFGTETRSSNSPFLKKDALLDTNTAYKSVSFSSQNPDGNQSTAGVYKFKIVHNTMVVIKQDYDAANRKRGKDKIIATYSLRKK
jgi:RHS repeat-associated protein